LAQLCQADKHANTWCCTSNYISLEVMLGKRRLQAAPGWHICSTTAAFSAARQVDASTGDAAGNLNYNMLGRQVGCQLYLWKKQQICHSCPVSPDEDGGLLKEGNLVAQVQTLQVHNLHHVVCPLAQDARLQLPCIQHVPPCLVRPVHNCHRHWLLTGLQCKSLSSHSMLQGLTSAFVQIE